MDSKQEAESPKKDSDDGAEDAHGGYVLNESWSQVVLVVMPEQELDDQVVAEEEVRVWCFFLLLFEVWMWCYLIH